MVDLGTTTAIVCEVGEARASDLDAAKLSLAYWQRRRREALMAARKAEREAEQALDHVRRCEQLTSRLGDLAAPDGPTPFAADSGGPW